MQVHALDLIDNFSLIGIHTSEEDYKLAYLLNKHLLTQFKKSSEYLDFKNKKASFPIFKFIDKNKQLSSYLIPNKTIGKNSENTTENLFSKEEFFSSTAYLIQEKKKIDYFLKIEGEITNVALNKTIEKINKIEQIITSYQIDPLRLASKDYLIF